MWIYLGILSAFFLGLYDIAKKHAVHSNAVFQVLFFATLSGAAVMAPGILLSGFFPSTLAKIYLFVPPISIQSHGFLFVKSVIVSSAWCLTFFALKHLPISIVAPIAASGPVWTLIGAVLIFRESPAPLQWTGMGIGFLSYYAFIAVSREEGIVFHKNKWIYFAWAGAILNAGSALYDKFLIQSLKIPPMAVQAWFTVYMVPLFGLAAAVFDFHRKEKAAPFTWRFSIPLAGILLIAADFAYFRALHDERALIAVLTVIRRSSVVLSFALGGKLFKENQLRKKALALAGILLGVFLVLVSS